MIDYEDTSYMQIIEKNANIDKALSFQEISLDFAFDVLDFSTSPPTPL